MTPDAIELSNKIFSDWPIIIVTPDKLRLFDGLANHPQVIGNDQIVIYDFGFVINFSQLDDRAQALLQQ